MDRFYLSSIALVLLGAASLPSSVGAFAPSGIVSTARTNTKSTVTTAPLLFSSVANDDDWQGDIVSNQGGTIRGCTVQAVGEDPVTEWILKIDGTDADLGRFSQAIYKKIMTDAKQQRFQGFRPGTIPPHLEPTYRAYSMEECAKETVLEAMEQNSIRPFTDARTTLVIGNVRIPPPVKKGNKKKKKKGNKKKEGMATDSEEPEPVLLVEEEPQWLEFEDMKGAIDAGWKPGQSFSFVATNAKGQKLLSTKETDNAKPLGLNY